MQEAEDTIDIQRQWVGSCTGEGIGADIHEDVISLGRPMHPNTSAQGSHMAATFVLGRGGIGTRRATRSRGQVQRPQPQRNKNSSVVTMQNVAPDGMDDNFDSWYEPPPKRQCGTGQGRASPSSTKSKKEKAEKKAEDAKAEALLCQFRPSTWKKDIAQYRDPPLPFTGPEPGYIHPYGRLPSLLGLFDKFWSQKL